MSDKKMTILQALAQMLEKSKQEKITTAALARTLSLSESALYRHFASKAQMFEGLIDFISETIFTLINHIARSEDNPYKRVQSILIMLIQFAETNRGMTRVLVGEALVHENERLQERMNHIYAQIEVALKNHLQIAAADGYITPQKALSLTSTIMAFVAGKWLRFVKTGFQQMPSANLQEEMQLLFA